jgi:aryl-alcohol dehydrogenase-like predicted oxidoreductase
LHWPDRPLQTFGGMTYRDYGDEGWEPFEAILEALNRHVEAGRILHLGVSERVRLGRDAVPRGSR